VARGLAPVGVRSAPETCHCNPESESGDRFCDCFAVERGGAAVRQAPSPQARSHRGDMRRVETSVATDVTALEKKS
jgi:hypothetical protein